MIQEFHNVAHCKHCGDGRNLFIEGVVHNGRNREVHYFCQTCCKNTIVDIPEEVRNDSP